MKIRATLEHEIASNVPFACKDIHAAMQAINFDALSYAMERNDSPSGFKISGSTATIYVRGLLVSHMRRDMSDWGITGYNHIIDYIAQANADDSITNIILDVNSQGGTTTGVTGAARAVAESAKPIEAYASGTMASAAYWLSAHASTITANEDSTVGSLGVIAIHYDTSEKLKQQGVKPTIIRSGQWKGAFSSIEPLSEDHIAKITEMVEASANIFYDYVAEGRGLTRMAIKSLGGDTFSAADAKTHGLIDKISDKPTTNQSTNLAQAKGTDMDLTEALAKITTLEASNAEKDKLLAAAASEKRQDKITGLEAKAGRVLTDQEKVNLAALDDATFEIAASFIVPPVTTTAPTAPVTTAADNSLVTMLLNAQATTGRQVDTEAKAATGLDAAFAAAKQNMKSK